MRILRAVAARINSTSTMSLEKEPAGAFNKAQRLIERSPIYMVLNVLQVRHRTYWAPAEESPLLADPQGTSPFLPDVLVPLDFFFPRPRGATASHYFSR
jgi:hypothetical protein